METIMPSRQSFKNALATGVWLLWIDSVGGFRLLEGERFTIGGPGGENPADIAVRSAWRRQLGSLIRVGDDLWYQQAAMPNGAVMKTTSRPVVFDERLPIDGQEQSPEMNEPILIPSKPSPLSGSVVVTLRPPHRFLSPVDTMILFDKTLLIGRENTNHIRAPRLVRGGLVLTKRADQWSIRRTDGSKQAMNEGERIEIDELVMTIRRENTQQIGEKR